MRIHPAQISGAASMTVSSLACGQTITNPSFEETAVPEREAFMIPVSPGYTAQLQAPNAVQVAFIQGDPNTDMGSFPIKSIKGVDVTGLNIAHHIVEAANSTVGSESTLFDNFKIRAGRSAN